MRVPAVGAPLVGIWAVVCIWVGPLRAPWGSSCRGYGLLVAFGEALYRLAFAFLCGGVLEAQLSGIWAVVCICGDLLGAP